MQIGIAQINTTVGDLKGNRERILSAYRELVSRGAELIVFPELVVTGYPPRDLLFKSRFVPDNLESLREIASQIGEVPAIVGFVDPNPSKRGRDFYNAAAWCHEGQIHRIAHKTLLPTYDVFDEDRYFESAAEPTLVEWNGKRIAITVCEDIWIGPEVETSKHYHRDPVDRLAGHEIDFMINLSASPWFYGKHTTRYEIVHHAARRIGAPVVYANAVGGNDELIFDGHSMVVRADGTLLAGLPGFTEALRVIDLDSDDTHVEDDFEQEELAEIYSALVLGLRDYAFKSGFKRALLGLSGGIDSALTAAIAVSAFGKENVIGVSLPSTISSKHSRSDARDLAANLGIRFETIGIEPLVKGAHEALAPLFEGLDADVTEENIQARSRGLILMALSNKFGSILLTTGNKSELAVGYCTLYGDMAGGLAVISDVPKTKVFEVCRWLNRDSEVIPWNTITKPPSAELRPDQKDEDSLPPYDVLDAILKLYVEEGRAAQEIIARGYDEDVVRDVIRKVDLNEYKRKQAAPGLKITPRAFGVGRRIPIVQRYVS